MCNFSWSLRWSALVQARPASSLRQILQVIAACQLRINKQLWAAVVQTVKNMLLYRPFVYLNFTKTFLKYCREKRIKMRPMVQSN